MIEFQSIYGLIVAALAAGSVVAIVAFRRLALPHAAVLVGAIGLIALALAAGEPVFRRSDRARVVVMVDYSASTRTAGYRDRTALQRRIDQLLPSTVERRITYFSDHDQTDRPTSDMPGDRTIFAPPPDVDAVLLLSDGQFQLPRESPPVFAVIDPALESAVDTAVADLETRNENRVAATVQNRGTTARLTFDGAADDPREPFGDGTFIVETNRNADASTIRATITDARDAWPENDQLSIIAPPPVDTERWWIGERARPGFRSMPVLPTDPIEFAKPSTIVLHDAPTSSEARRLTQYVRDLGGAVVLLDRALSLDLSPLSLHPPEPKRHWIILIDSSGSMAANIDPSRTRFAAAVSAARALVDALPPDDLVSTAGFARDLNWWTVDRPARDTREHFASNDTPNGPTNLQAALEQVATRPRSAIPIELIVITDADATIASAPTIVGRMAMANVHANAFALAPAPTALNDIVRATGGRFLTATWADSWARELRELGELIAPPTVVNEPVAVSFDDSLQLTRRDVSPWQRAWPTSGAAAIATAQFESQPIVLAADQQVGIGRVCAVAFAPNDAELDAIVRRSESAPRDPRLTVSLRRDAPLHITVDAFDRATNQYLNGMRLSLRLGDRQSIQQTAPGRYEIAIDPAREPSIAVITNDADFRETVVSRVAIAGRYAPEFDAIGVNRALLQMLARRTGGRVIEPGNSAPIDVRATPRVAHPLTTILAAIGFVALSLGVVTWRRAA